MIFRLWSVPRLFLVFGLAVTFGSSVRAQDAQPVGSQLQVNSYTPGYQIEPEVAVTSDGRFVVVWESYDATIEDGDIVGRVFDSTGTPISDEVVVNSFTTDTQTDAAVAALGDDRFVVAWRSEGDEVGDTSTSVQAQLLSSTGTRLGEPFRVNTYTTGPQGDPRIAADPSGDFVVVWRSLGSAGTDTAGYSIQARRFTSNGTAKGDQVQVNSYATGRQRLPDVAVSTDGSFVVVWESRGSAGTDTDRESIQAQRFASDGSAVADEFQVNTYTSEAQSAPTVGMDDDGRFTIVWYGDTAGGSGNDLAGRRFDADGAALGGEFQVNTYTFGDQFRQKLAMDADGGFTVAWIGNQDGDGRGIETRRFASDGSPIGDFFVVNTYTTDHQNETEIAMEPSGDFVVVWESNGSLGDDSDQTSIQAQPYRVTGSIGDRVWLDLDGNGTQEAGEPGVANVGVEIFDALLTSRGTTQTDIDGFFRLEVPPGDYSLEFRPPVIYDFTLQGIEDDSIDSDVDPATGTTAVLPVELGVDRVHVDAGLVVADSLIFADGFESGDLSSWTLSSP